MKHLKGFNIVNEDIDADGLSAPFPEESEIKIDSETDKAINEINFLLYDGCEHLRSLKENIREYDFSHVDYSTFHDTLVELDEEIEKLHEKLDELWEKFSACSRKMVVDGED